VTAKGVSRPVQRRHAHPKTNIALQPHAKGTKSGKAIGRPTISKAKAAQIRAELARGTGILKTAKLLKAGSAVVHRIKREM
jgi:hypothetical protein